MQEVSEETVCQDGSVLVWPCPLCQQGRPDRDALAQHLTEKHSVLPACLDRLMDTASPVKSVCRDGAENNNTHYDSGDTCCSLQMPSEFNGALSDQPENSTTTEAKKEVASTCLLRSEGKIHSFSGEEDLGEGEGKQGLGRDNLEQGRLSSQQPESTLQVNQKVSLQLTATTNSGNDGTTNNTGKMHADPALEKFHDPTRPFKCNACLESFTSKSALSVHYNSASHLHRMRTGSSMQSDEKETSSTTSAPAPYLSRPFFTNKPYQCAVCRVSYNHAFTLESHLKSVLHQTRSRNTVSTTSSVAGNSGKKGNANVGGSMSTGVNPSSSSATQPGETSVSSPTGNGSSQGSLSGPTKDGEKSAVSAPAASAPCPQTIPGLSLLSSPVASAQAVSAFLTLLTSTAAPSVQPSLLAAGSSGTPSVAVPQLELIAQRQLLLPLFLNGLQAQNQGSNPESASAVVTQAVPLLGLSAAQQALLVQRLSTAQSQIPLLAAGLPEAMLTCTAEKGQAEISACIQRVKKELEEDEEKEGEGRVDQSVSCRFEAVENSVTTAEPVKELGEMEPNCTLKSKMKRLSGDAVEAQGEEERVKDSPMEETNDEAQGEGTDKPSGKFCDGLSKLETSCSPVSSETTALIGTGSSPEPRSDSGYSLDFEKTTDHCADILKPGPTQPCPLNSASCLNPNDSLLTGENLTGPSLTFASPVLSEFQSQVLWAFLESRSEADAADPPLDDCVALGKEVGLSGQQVRRWLEEARREHKERPRGAACKVAVNKAEDDGVMLADELEEGVLTIVETDEGKAAEESAKNAMDLSQRREKGHGGGQGKETPEEPCLTSDSDNEGDGLYTSVIVTDEDSQSGPAAEELGAPTREDLTGEQVYKGRGGKVLRSSTVFLSDAEDTEEEEDGDCGVLKVKKRKRNRELEGEEVDVKKERLDPDVDLELDAQADPPVPISVDQQSIPNVLQPLPLSISLSPFATRFINPYVLSIPPSAIGLGIGEGDRDRVRLSTFPNSATITHSSATFTDPHSTPPPASHVSPVLSLSNGGICESALDLSMGKKHNDTSSCASSADRVAGHGEPMPECPGLRPSALGVPGPGGLIVVRVKPDSALAISTPDRIANSNNARASTVYIRAAERINASLVEREREKQQERERERARAREREKEGAKEHKPKARRFRDMRRSRTIIQTEQLDVLYGCYFKDPNPGKHEFEQISEWVHLPKKVVQIWFQNMRARERKGEVRFISDGTLAAVGKPLIKFTWPLTLPIFSGSPSPNSSPLSTGDSAVVSPKAAAPKAKAEAEQGKEKEVGQPKDSGKSNSTPLLNSSAGISQMFNLKPKPETQSSGGTVGSITKAINTTPEIPAVLKTRLPSPSSCSPKRKHIGEDDETGTDEEDEVGSRETVGPGATNRMVPKMSSTSTHKSLSPGSHKRNGLNDWTPKGSYKINTLSREQLGLSMPRSSGTTPSSSAKASPHEGAYQQHSSSPRRPRTHLTSLQVSIMQSCYETCPHPNALECETIGTELGLPLKVVQIWFQNTRAKEKRWRLQQLKQSPGSADSSKKVDTSSGSFLLYSALRANRPILPKPVQLTVLEPSTPPAPGQAASRETLRGRCDACGVTFESRAAGRTHVFSPDHLATLRTTNFGHPPSLVNSGSATGSSAGTGAASQSSPSAASSIS